ncbi:MAG: hypothetical protein J6M15_11090 [Prevotella sp.]|nr:hypothetical protein [Prevotella sp.]
MKKLFTLLTLALISIGSAWGQDAVSATQTFTNERATCTWTSINVSVAKENTAGGDGLYFTAPSDKDLSGSGTTIQFGKCAWIGYVEVPSATSAGEITIISSTDAADRKLYLESGSYLVCAKTGSTVEFTASDVVSFEGGYYIKLSNTDKSDYKFKSIAVTLSGGEKYPESVAVDPVFSLNKSSITTAQTAQICVGSRNDLDGIAFDGAVTYGTPGIVKVDENGVVTPVAVGTTTINFNTSAVATKYNASTSNTLTITVTEAILVFDAAGLTNADIFLTQANVDSYDYLTSNNETWQDKGWSAPYNGKFLDWKTNRIITLKVKNVTAFELFVNGTAGRTYTIKVGKADAVTYTQGGETFNSSGIIATGTTDEVTLEFEGGSQTLYPVYVRLNPAVDAEITSAGYATFSSDKAVDFSGASGVTVYAAKVNDAKTAVDLIEVKSKQVPANTAVVLKGAAGTYTASAIASAATISGNQLQIAAATMNGDAGNIYVLNEVGGVVGFYKLSATGSLLAGKGYLVVDGVGEGRAMLDIDIEGISTGINMVNGEGLKVNGSETYYDLQGRRVLNPTKGLYIVNGKKVIVK